MSLSFTYIIIFMIVIILIKLYLEADFFQLKCIVSSVDGNKYCVRERSKLHQATNLLAKTNTKLRSLVDYLDKKMPKNKDIDRLVDGFDDTKINETLPTSEFTAYSENKGQKMAFCLHKRKGGTKLIDENTLMFVALHELSHIMTLSVGHTDEFWNNFKFLLTHAIKLKLYHPVDYKKKPQPYCGMKITDNPYFDLD